METTPDEQPPDGLVSSTADTEPPPAERPSVEMVDTPDWTPPDPTSDMQRVLNALSQLSSKVDTLVSRDEDHRVSDRQLDRMSQQLGAIASVVQTFVFERDAGNGLSGARVLLVEDDEDLGATCQRTLRRRGCDVVSWVQDAASARQAVMGCAPEQAATHAVVDIKLGEHYGVEIARLIRRHWPDTAVILTTGFADESTPPGVADFALLKPFTGETLAEAIVHTWRLDRPASLQ